MSRSLIVICPGRLPRQRAKRRFLVCYLLVCCYIYYFVSEKITDPLIKRIRSLEHALETIQVSHSDKPHPLLRKELREIPDKLRDVSVSKLAAVIETTTVAVDASTKPHESTSVGELSENLGTLSLEGYGKSRFFGNSASTLVRII